MFRPAAIEVLHVQEFCRSVVPGENLVSVECQPLSGKPENECFAVIPEHIASHGGEQVLGWAIWERPGVFIEAEFHAIWRNPEGSTIDISPRAFRFESIAFLPDPNRKYSGRSVDNVRKSLVKDRDVTRFLFLSSRRFEIMNTGSLADQYGYLSLPKKLEREYRDVMKELIRLEARIMSRYPPSWAGSGGF